MMTEMPDDVITDLIAVIVAARADGDGVWTVAAVRARLAEAKLRVERVEDCGEGEDLSAVVAERLRKILRKN